MNDMPDLTNEIRRDRHGFTLLEVMVAVSIIAIVFVSVFRVHLQTLSMSQRIRFNSMTSLLAQSKLAEYEAKPLAELFDDSGNFGENFPGYGWQVAITDVESEVLDDAAENLKKIEIIVSYQEGESFRIDTYRLIQD